MCSESAAINLLEYTIVRDVSAGETIIFEQHGVVWKSICSNAKLTPCLFEYIYFARADSVIEKIDVLDARLIMGVLIQDIFKLKLLIH